MNECRLITKRSGTKYKIELSYNGKEIESPIVDPLAGSIIGLRDYFIKIMNDCPAVSKIEFIISGDLK